MSAVNITNETQNFWGQSLYLRSPGYDWFWFILSPLWAIVIGWIMTQWLFQETVTVLDTTETTAFFLYLSLTQAHLLITAFRTHANPKVLDRFFWRFTLIPILVLFAAISSNWIFTALFVLMVFWDVYHSAMQVFGFARIYDRNAGNDLTKGRVSDYLLCAMMYIGPVFAGALFLDHVAAFSKFADIEQLDLLGLLISGQPMANVPATAETFQGEIRLAMFTLAGLIVSLYLWNLVRMSQAGYRMPLPKIAMFATTTIACISAWGFNSFAMGYLIANVFHAVQYFALVWIMEDTSIARVLPVPSPLKLALYLTIPLSMGLILVAWDSRGAQALLMVCALMHFWWDSFIWSTRSPKGFPGSDL